MSANRIKYIDIAKGIAIICIILGHFNIENINRVVFTFHVPIFFCITGYFISNKDSIEIFVKKKIKTLIVPYIITCIIISLIATINALYVYGLENAKHTLLRWILISIYGSGDIHTSPIVILPIGATWFLLAAFWGSFFLRATLEVKKETRLILVVLLFLLGYWSSKFFWFPLSIQVGLCATGYMYLGYICRMYKEKYEKVHSKTKNILTMIALIIWIMFIKNFESFGLVRCDIGRGFIDVIGSICGCYIVMVISKYIETKAQKTSNLLSNIGRYSLLILCIHNIEMNCMPWREVIKCIRYIRYI